MNGSQTLSGGRGLINKVPLWMIRKLIGPVMRFHETLDAVRALEKIPEFSRFSSSVKSQLRRSIYLHSEFVGRA
jgi:hypothetical protein